MALLSMLSRAPGTPPASFKAADNASESGPQVEALVRAIDRSQAVIEFELDGTIVIANDNFLNAVGYTVNEIVGRHHRMFVEEGYSNSTEYSRFWEDLRRGEFVSGEFKRIRKNGEEIWISATYNPVFDESGKVVKVIKFANDITVTKKESEDSGRLKNMVDNMPLAMMYVDRQLIIRYANDASMQLLKKVQSHLPIPVENLIGTCIDTFHKNPDHQRRLLDDPSHLPLTTQIQLGDEKLTFSVNAIYNDSGEYIGAMASGRIITEELRTKQEAASVGQTVRRARPRWRRRSRRSVRASVARPA